MYITIIPESEVLTNCFSRISDPNGISKNSTFFHNLFNCIPSPYVIAESRYKAELRLEEMLLKGYRNEIRPVLHHKDNVTITVGISLNNIKNMVIDHFLL